MLNNNKLLYHRSPSPLLILKKTNQHYRVRSIQFYPAKLAAIFSTINYYKSYKTLIISLFILWVVETFQKWEAQNSRSCAISISIQRLKGLQTFGYWRRMLGVNCRRKGESQRSTIFLILSQNNAFLDVLTFKLPTRTPTLTQRLLNNNFISIQSAIYINKLRSDSLLIFIFFLTPHLIHSPQSMVIDNNKK